MKKILLFATFLASALGMSAQTDVTSTYLTDPGFENATASTGNAAAGDKANTTGGTNGGWTYSKSSTWSASAVVAYGGSGTVNNVSAPAADNFGESGNAFGVSVGWGGTELWQTASTTLPAGTYALVYFGYNNLSGVTQITSKVGFGSNLSSKKAFTYGTWEADVVFFTLDSDTEGTFQVGGTAISGGSGSNAKVFIDNLTLLKDCNAVIIPNSQSIEYGNSVPTEFTSTVKTTDGGSLSGDITYQVQDADGNAVSDTPAVGTYYITATYSGSDYNVGVVTGRLIVTPVAATMTLGDATVEEYAGLPTSVEYTLDPTTATVSDVVYKYTHTTTKGTCEIDDNAGPGTYAITATATSDYSLTYNAGTLTITEKTYGATDNLNFSVGTPLLHGVCTYDYDTAPNGTTRSGLQTLPGWTPNKTRENGMAGGLFAVGGGAFLGGSGYTVPTAQADGVEGANVIGLIAVWGGNDGVEASYTATKDLEAGTYIVTIPVYNAGGESALKANYTGITCGEASATATTTKYTVNAWTTETLTLKVTEAGTATIKIGGLFGDYGSGNAPHLFFGSISIEKQTATVVTIDDKEVAYGTTPDYSYTTEDEKTLEGEMTYSLQDSEGNEVTDTPSVGTYTIVGTYSGDEEVKIVNGKLTVTAATVKITVKDDEMTEYGTMPEFSYEVTEGTAPADLTLVATYSKADNSKTPVTYTIEIDETAAPGEYTITAKSEDTNYTLEVTPGTLTVAAKTYDATENLDFSAGDAINIGVTTYDYDTAKNGTTRSGLQSVPCWTPSTAGNNSNGNARAGGLYTAGSDAFIGAKTYKVPESAPEGSNMLLGTMSVWGAEASYTTTKTLAAGVYTLSIPVYNSGNTSSKFTNKIGYKVGEGDAVYATATTYGAEWTTETFTIKVAEESTVTISLGLSYGGGSSNNGAPCLFFGAVTLEEAATESITFTESNKGNDTNVVYVATYVAPYDIDVTALKSNGVTAYELSVTDGKVTYTEIKKDIPEGTPLVVSAGATGTYSVPRATGTTETVTTDLKKGDGSTTVGDGKTIYTLQRGSTSKKLGWYLKKEGDAIAATKCYLEIAEGSSVKDNFIGFDSTATGISGIAADSVKMDGKMYSVSGQQVDENYKGIVIVNGKKYLNK